MLKSGSAAAGRRSVQKTFDTFTYKVPRPRFRDADLARRHRMLIARHWQLLARLRQAGLPLDAALASLEALTRLNRLFNQAASSTKNPAHGNQIL